MNCEIVTIIEQVVKELRRIESTGELQQQTAAAAAAAAAAAYATA